MCRRATPASRLVRRHVIVVAVLIVKAACRRPARRPFSVHQEKRAYALSFFILVPPQPCRFQHNRATSSESKPTDDDDDAAVRRRAQTVAAACIDRARRFKLYVKWIKRDVCEIMQ
jgi:hypothetical protein